MVTYKRLRIVSGAFLIYFSASQFAFALGTISYLGVTNDVTDYQAMGVGADGYWFANFGQTADTGLQDVDSNHVNQFPSWTLPDFDPDSPGFSFTSDGGIASRGGVPEWNDMVLPGGESGKSGTVVDPNADNNSNNTLSNLLLGPGVPNSFLMHVVVDNTNNEHDPANRIRARAEDGATGEDTDFRVNLSTSDFNGVADVYTFQFDGWVAGDFLKIQLNSGVDGIDPGFAGLMFDKVPEPSSIVLCVLGAIGVGFGAWRRR